MLVSLRVGNYSTTSSRIKSHTLRLITTDFVYKNPRREVALSLLLLTGSAVEEPEVAQLMNDVVVLAAIRLVAVAVVVSRPHGLILQRHLFEGWWWWLFSSCLKDVCVYYVKGKRLRLKQPRR